MEHQKLTLRGCLGLIVFTLSLLLGFWLVVKFDMCSFRVTGEGNGLENRSTIGSVDFGHVSYKRFQFDNPFIICYPITKLPKIETATLFLGNHFDDQSHKRPLTTITRHRKTPEHAGDARPASHLCAPTRYRNITRCSC